MRLRLSVAALAAAIVALGLATRPLVAQAPTVDAIVAKNIQAKGGLDKLRSITTSKQTSDFTMQGGHASVVVYGKRPNLLRQELTVPNPRGGTVEIINGFDGTTPWIVNPLAGITSPVVMTGPQADALRAQADFDGPLIDYQSKGYRIALAGQDTINGRTVNHLRVTDKGGMTEDYDLDADTGLETRITSQTPSGTFEQDLADFRAIDGVTVPFSIQTRVNGVLEVSIQVKTLQFNLPLDDALFKIPQH